MNVETFDGVSEAGSGNDIATRLTSARDRGRETSWPGGRGSHRPVGDVGSYRGGVAERAEVPERGHHGQLAFDGSSAVIASSSSNATA